MSPGYYLPKYLEGLISQFLFLQFTIPTCLHIAFVENTGGRVLLSSLIIDAEAPWSACDAF
jgi:hypothetical protein